MSRTHASAAKPRASLTLPPGDTLAAFAPFVFLLLWSSGFGLAKVGLAHAEPLTFLALRYAVIVALFIPAFLVLRPALPERRMDWVHIAVVGFLIQAVYFGFAYGGMALGVSAGVAAVIASTQPLVVALAAPLVANERVGGRQWLGLALGLAGAVTVIGAGSTFDTTLNLGLLLCVGSMFGMAAATLYQKRFVAKAHPVTVNLVHYAVGLIAVGPVAAAFETMQIDWTPGFIMALAYLVIANSVFAVSLLLFMIRRSEASRVSSLFFLIPPVAALVGWFVLGETLSSMACVGMAVAAAGVWLVTRPN
jgi:drug/metabolite transporter (DMT)-like permease